jgi:hypothetical protein
MAIDDHKIIAVHTQYVSRVLWWYNGVVPVNETTKRAPATPQERRRPERRRDESGFRVRFTRPNLMSIHRPIGYHTNGTKRTLIQRISASPSGCRPDSAPTIAATQIAGRFSSIAALNSGLLTGVIGTNWTVPASSWNATVWYSGNLSAFHARDALLIRRCQNGDQDL